MKVTRHFRLFDVKRKTYVLNFYVHKGFTIQRAAAQAMAEFSITLKGPYRIDRLVRVDGNHLWLQGQVLIL